MISNAIRNDLELCKQYANKQAVQERNFQVTLTKDVFKFLTFYGIIEFFN